LIISVEDTLAKKHGIKILKITNRNNEVLVNATNIAGVELDKDSCNEEDDEDYNANLENHDEEDVDNDKLYDRINPTENERINGRR
jgi:hypothetical protein